MVKEVSVIEVYFENRRVGKLAQPPGQQCLFEYDTEWINTGFSVSPFYLPLKSGVFTARAEPFDGLFGVFNDSLPDGWGKLLIDKWLQSKGVNPAGLSVLDRLSLVGDSGMGALTYLPAQNTDSMELHQIGFYASEAEKIIHQDYSGALEELVNKAGS